MAHSDFVQAWNVGKLEVDVDRSKALQVASSKMLPKRYQAAHIFWSWVWILSIPAALAVMFLYKWWAGLLILVLVTPDPNPLNLDEEIRNAIHDRSFAGES